MKIKDIIVESEGKLSHRLQKSTVGLLKFKDPKNADRVYELNRVMMAAAAADGINPLIMNPDEESWIGRYNLAAPYTKEEQDMMIQAYDAIGTKYEDLNKGDLRSQELDSTNIKSPIAKPKKNKYGV
jgi:hypothetical protein